MEGLTQLLLTAFSKVYSDNWKKKAEGKDVRNTQFKEKRMSI